MKTDPPADTQVEKGTQVTLYVSRESVQASKKVPNVVGRDLQTAIELLEAVGLKVTYQEVESDKEPNTVLTQSIERNEYVVSGATIELTVSNGMGYYKPASLTIEFPKLKKSMEYRVIVYVDDEAAASYTIDIKESRYLTASLQGSGVSAVKVAVDGAVYAEYEVNFDEGTALLIRTDDSVFGDNLRGGSSDNDDDTSEDDSSFSFSDWFNSFLPENP